MYQWVSILCNGTVSSMQSHDLEYIGNSFDKLIECQNVLYSVILKHFTHFNPIVVKEWKRAEEFQNRVNEK